MKKYAYKFCNMFPNFLTNAQHKKNLDGQIGAMVHIMQIDHEWCFLIFQLDYHICFSTLKDIHPINFKCD
jgi:hypothetical protein